MKGINLFGYQIKKNIPLYIMILPGLTGYILFRFIPILMNAVIGFTEYNLVDGFFGSQFAGLEYFRQFFQDPFFFRILKNTLVIGLLRVIWSFPAPIVLALLLNEIRSSLFKRVTQSVTYLPHFISLVVVVGMMNMLFGSSGIIRTTVLALTGNDIDFMSDPGWFRTMYIGSDIWQKSGWSSIIYLAALTSIPQEQYEAATVDGAGRWKRMLNITLPGLAPAITVMLIIEIGNIIDVGFSKIYLMYSPVNYSVSDVISTYVYRRGIVGSDFSYAGAVGFFDSVISLLLVTAANFISRKTSEHSLF